MSYFPEVPNIPFEGPGSRNQLAFEHYQAEEVVEVGVFHAGQRIVEPCYWWGDEDRP